MIVVYVSVQTKAQAANEFERIIREIQADIRTLTGCVKNEWFRVPDVARRYVMYGEFASRKDFEAYLNSAIVKRIGDELIPLLDAPPEFKHYEAVILESS
jgi:quinol monooxygenase YgiN